ncbi:alpha/beta fold hydrolase [Ornithinimicrobium ciconiae]|uniref:Proline iminopeptidase n=1 Tax=Ornithinimicrobium ciconiae TaxID=2594265 RepID=A0A516GF46_9MICO|nr:alpha/beta fold hydrolase [Ornithinimicrobium ciconiae]QDO90151.1 alpha/beta fold hydrolase [Ornithinimicrobium ciconiae]
MPVEPYDSGQLTLRDGAQIYWEVSGNPEGVPLLWLHGGPGTGLGSGGYKRQPDPDKWLIVGLDQRACGRSSPLATEDGFDLETLRVPNLVADLEELREHLAIDRWLIVGGSFGSTLALAYGQAHPDRVIAFVLMAVADGSRDYVEWISEDVRRIFPEAWADFERGAQCRGGERLLDAYVRQLTDPDPAVRQSAALNWCTWEDAHMQLPGGLEPGLVLKNAQWREVYALQVAWAWSTQFTLPEGGVQAGLSRIAHLPAVLVHGRLDVSGPVAGAWRLNQDWPSSRLVVIEDEGHGGPQMTATWRAALEELYPLATQTR